MTLHLKLLGYETLNLAEFSETGGGGRLTVVSIWKKSMHRGRTLMDATYAEWRTSSDCWNPSSPSRRLMKNRLRTGRILTVGGRKVWQAVGNA